MNKQYKEREATPFQKHLKNLHLNQRDIQHLVRDLNAKMFQYKIAHWWSELRQQVTQNLLEAGDKWPLSQDQIGYYVALGLSLAYHPDFKSKQGIDEDTEEETNP